MSGHIALDRAAFDHPLLRDGDRFRAWFWLVAKAAWRATKIDVHGHVVTVQRGQLCVSVRQLADHWGWSKSATDRFLKRLETEKMVNRTCSKTGTPAGTASGTVRQLITICNYDKYQAVKKPAGTKTGTASGTRAGQRRDRKEEGEPFNKREASASLPADELPIPSDFRPILTPAAQRVVDGWPPGIFDLQLDRFRDHAATTGRLAKDWQAAFRTWISKTEERRQSDGNRNRPHHANDTFTDPYVIGANERETDRQAERASLER